MPRLHQLLPLQVGQRPAAAIPLSAAAQQGAVRQHQGRSRRRQGEAWPSPKRPMGRLCLLLLALLFLLLVLPLPYQVAELLCQIRARHNGAPRAVAPLLPPASFCT